MEAMEHAADAERMAERGGMLQGLDPRIKVLGALALIVTAVLVQSLAALALLFAAGVALALCSRVSLARLAAQLWLGVLLFTGVLAAPAFFLVPGDPLAHLPLLNWAITAQGLRSAAFLVGRAEISATYALLTILTTPWPHVLKALRSLGVPVVPVAILGMTHRYIHLLLASAVDLIEARRSRLLAPMSAREHRRLAAGTAAVLLEKALLLHSEIHLAMIARGYRGEVYLLDDFRTRGADWVAVAGVAALVAAALAL